MAKQSIQSGGGVQGRLGQRYELTDQAWQRLDRSCPDSSVAANGTTIATRSTAFYGYSTAAHSGVTCPSATAGDKASAPVIADGHAKVCSIVCSIGCTSCLTRMGASIGACSTSMPQTSAPIDRLREPVEKGQKEPAAHAVGRSRGGFGTNLHLVTDGRGVPLRALITADPSHVQELRKADGRGAHRPTTTPEGGGGRRWR